jgi:hypothetical protein
MRRRLPIEGGGYQMWEGSVALYVLRGCSTS